MPISKGLYDKIVQYEKDGYTPDEIVSGLSQSTSYPGIASRMNIYIKDGYDSPSILKGLKDSYVPIEMTPPVEQTGGTGSLLDKVYHGAATGASGFNKGVANLAGMPVDILNKALGLVGLSSNEPVLGSEYISKNFMPEPVKPEGLTETTINAIGEQVPYFMPGVGVAAKTGQLGNAILQSGKVALGAGAGSGVARTYAPDNPYLDMAAQLAGGLTPSAVKGVVRTLPESIERNIMERAMKPSTVLKEGERTKRLETALNEGITTTKSGLEKSKNTITEINNEIQQKINQLNEEGAIINMDRAMNPATEWAQEALSKEAFPNKPTKQVESVLNEFGAKPSEIPLRDAQNYKQSINKELDDFYKALNTSPDKTTLLSRSWMYKTKAKIADGLRKEIGEVFPEIKDLNSREASLIQLNKSLEQAVSRISQHDIWSLKGVISLVAHPRYAVMNYVLNNPSVQSSLAVAIRKARTSPMNTSGILSEVGKQTNEE